MGLNKDALLDLLLYGAAIFVLIIIFFIFTVTSQNILFGFLGTFAVLIFSYVASRLVGRFVGERAE